MARLFELPTDIVLQDGDYVLIDGPTRQSAIKVLLKDAFATDETVLTVEQMQATIQQFLSSTSSQNALVTALLSRMDAAEGGLITQGQAIADAAASLATAKTDVQALQAAASANNASDAQQDSTIAQLRTDLTTAQNTINTLTQAGGAVESANGTTITSGTAGSGGRIYTASAAHYYTIDAGVVKRDGSAYGTTTGTADLGLYFGGFFYYHNAAGAWYKSNNDTTYTLQLGDPRLPQAFVESLAGATVGVTGGELVDNALNRWKFALQTPDSVSVMSYGAAGNGSTDDTTAIFNADAAAKTAGKALYFPPGTYKHGIVHNTGIVWYGAGETSILKAALQTASSIYQDHAGGRLYNLKIDGSGTGRNDGFDHNCVSCKDTSDVGVENCHIIKAAGVGISFSNVSNGFSKNNLIEDTYADSHHIAESCNGVEVSYCETNRSGDDSVGCVSYTTQINQNIKIHHNYFHDSNSGRGVAVLGGSNIQVYDNYIDNMHYASNTGVSGGLAGLYVGTEGPGSFVTNSLHVAAFSRNILKRCGGSFTGHGAIMLINGNGAGGLVCDGITFVDNVVLNSPRAGITTTGDGKILAGFTNLKVYGTSIPVYDPFNTNAQTLISPQGWGTLLDPAGYTDPGAATNAGRSASYNVPPAYVVQRNDAPSYTGFVNKGTTALGVELLKWGAGSATKMYYKDTLGQMRSFNGTAWVNDNDPRSTATESGDDTAIAQGAGVIRDASLNVFAITGPSDPAGAGAVTLNGQVTLRADGITPDTAFVDIGYYKNHTFYQSTPIYNGTNFNGQTGARGWWSYSAGSPRWVLAPDPRPGAATPQSRWRASTGNFNKDKARAWVANQRMRVNLERERPWTKFPNLDYVALKNSGATGVRFFYPWAASSNQDGNGVGSIQAASYYDARIGLHVSKALQAGLYVEVEFIAVLPIADQTTPAQQQKCVSFVTVMAQMFAARAAAEGWDLSKIAFGAVNEWASIPSASQLPTVNAFRLQLNGILRQILGAQAILALSPSNYDAVEQLVNMTLPTDGGPLVAPVHRYPGAGSGVSSSFWAGYQTTALIWSDGAGGGIPVVLSEFSPSDPNNADGSATNSNNWPPGIAAVAAGCPELRPCMWVISAPSSGTGTVWFMLNKAYNDPSFMDGTNSQPNVKQAYIDATNAIQAIAA